MSVSSRCVAASKASRQSTVVAQSQHPVEAAGVLVPFAAVDAQMENAAADAAVRSLGATSFAEQNAGHISKALEWVNSSIVSPHSQLILIRVVLAVLQHILKRHLVINEERWEIQQRVRAMRATAQGIGGHHGPGSILDPNRSLWEFVSFYRRGPQTTQPPLNP